MEEKIVTRSDCDVVIAKCIGSDKFEVVNFKVKPFEDKERQYYKPECVLEVSAKVAKTKNIARFRFFLKKFAKPELQSAKASERELFFYRFFLPMLRQGLDGYETDFVAQYLHGDIGRMMILEDMSLKFFTLAKKANPHMLDRFHLSLALKAIAKLHAGSLRLEGTQQGDTTSRMFDPSHLLSQEPYWVHPSTPQPSATGLLQSSLKGLEALLKEFQLKANLADLLQLTFDIMQPQTKYRNVLGHGDLHTKNLLFKYDKAKMPTECVLLNFGFCRYFLPAYDVLTLIFRSTTRLFRQHYFTYLVGYYHDCLHNELIKQEGLHIDQFLPLEDFKQSINFLMPAIKLQTVLHLEDFGAKPGFYKLLQKNAALHEKYMYEDKSPFVLDLIKKDPIFKESMGEALEELLETVTFPQVSRENCYEVLEAHLQTTLYELKGFALAALGDAEDTVGLTMEVSDGSKDGAIQKVNYLVQCSANKLFKVLKHVE